jgi:hypothetical protein
MWAIMLLAVDLMVSYHFIPGGGSWLLLWTAADADVYVHADLFWSWWTCWSATTSSQVGAAAT